MTHRPVLHAPDPHRSTRPTHTRRRVRRALARGATVGVLVTALTSGTGATLVATPSPASATGAPVAVIDDFTTGPYAGVYSTYGSWSPVTFQPNTGAGGKRCTTFTGGAGNTGATVNVVNGTATLAGNNASFEFVWACGADPTRQPLHLVPRSDSAIRIQLGQATDIAAATVTVYGRNNVGVGPQHAYATGSTPPCGASTIDFPLSDLNPGADLSEISAIVVIIRTRSTATVTSVILT
jgi:hypothetical protein